MIELLRRIIRFAVVIVVAFIGLVMALILTFSTIIAIVFLLVISRLRGKPFEIKEYWMARRTGRKSTSTQGSLSSKDVTDVESRDIR
jgi:5-bromo-4-chloroindolyl phosphate hydrolysis protein